MKTPTESFYSLLQIEQVARIAGRCCLAGSALALAVCTEAAYPKHLIEVGLGLLEMGAIAHLVEVEASHSLKENRTLL
jgi:hypothetical protein